MDGPADVGVREGRISEVVRVTAGARRVIDVVGRHVLPGAIDTHTHLSRHFGSAEGHAMVARTGVVTALDLAGSFDDLADDLAAGRADWSLARGRIVLADGQVTGRGGMLLVSPAGESVARSARVSHEVIHREGWR